MLRELAAAIERVDIPSDCDGLAEALGLLDRLTAKVNEAIGHLDAAGEWAADFAVSAVSWLQGRGGMSRKEAASSVQAARLLRRLPVTQQAWSERTLSGGQVRAVVANLAEPTLPMFAEQEVDLVPTLVPLSASQTANVMRFWRARAEALLDDGAEARMPQRSLHLSQTLGDRWVLDGELDAEGGELLRTAVRLATAPDVEGEPARTPAQRRGDALVDLARFYLDRQSRPSGGRHRPHLNVVVHYDDLVQGRGGELVDGGRLDGATVRRLLCDASVHRVVTDGDSTILDYGTSTRTVPPHLWAALVVRDRHCRHDGCDRPSEWCEAHHVVPVLAGGPTNLGNLVLKCSRHHHIGHLPGWREQLLPDGTLVVTDPAGRTRTTRPPGLLLPWAA
ncbi:MAG: HNH endonuclease [Actinomycetota bacterium]|nr:HNH endonuclease [Actinomycetota bacterium]